MNSRKKIFLMAICTLLSVWSLLVAQNSSNITLRGQILDINGEIMGAESTEIVNVIVKLFDAENSGNVRYTESFSEENSQGIAVDFGRLEIQLGSGTSIDTLTNVLAVHKNLWVEMTVNGNILTRTPLCASPFVLTGNSQINTASKAVDR